MKLSNLRKFFIIYFSYALILLYQTYTFIFTSNLAGRDLVGALSLVKVFGFEWSTKWFLGLPLFQFYPPGFFFTTSIIGSLTGDIVAFKLLTYISLLIFPITVYYCFKKIFDKETGLISLIISIFVVFVREPFSLVYQTLQVGLVAQSVSLPILFIYMAIIWKDSRDSYYISAVLMALLIIIHPFIALVALVYTLIYMFITKDLLGSISSSIGFLLTGWWWIPILEKTWYIQKYTGPTGKFMNWPWLFFPLAFYDISKESLTILGTGIFFLILGTFNLGLNIQFYRFFVYGQVLLVICVAPGLNKLFENFDNSKKKDLMVLLVFISVIGASINADISPDWINNSEINNTVIPEEGKVIVETSHEELYSSYVPIQKIPLRSNSTVVNGLYSDQSISSPYLLGLEKSFAKNPVPNPIAVHSNLTSQQLEKRFEYFGIEYAIIRTNHAREKLSFMRKESEHGKFTLLKKEIPEKNRAEAIPVKGTMKEWQNINRQIFKNNLTKLVYEPKNDNAIPIKNISYRKEKISVEIREESIRPVTKNQALFGLQYCRISTCN